MHRLCTLAKPFILAFTITCATNTAAAETKPDPDISRKMGLLTNTFLTVECADAPASEVFDALSEATGLNIIARYRTDKIDHGIAADLPISLGVANVSALYVLELVLEQCSIYEPCTWQFRNGVLEVGTKDRLSIPAAAERRTYELDSLMLDPPYFESPLSIPITMLGYPSGRAPARNNKSAQAIFDEHPYRPAALKDRVADRTTATESRNEILEGIVELVEPGNWDWGQHHQPLTQDADNPAMSDRARQVRAAGRKIASMRAWKTGVLIAAPPYMHYQIAGPPPGQMPVTLSPAELKDRTETAMRSRCMVEVVSVGPPPMAPVRLWPAGRQDIAVVIQRGDSETIVATLHDALVNQNMDFRFHGAARQALDTLQTLVGVPIIGRWDDDEIGHGIDPNHLINFELQDVPALQALEEIIAQCAIDEPCTWQIRKGFIEVGTKRRLSLPGARELRLHYVADLIIQIPDADEKRLPREIFALDVVEAIVENIEPDAWDWGQIDYSKPVEGDPDHITPGDAGTVDKRYRPGNVGSSATGSAAPHAREPIAARRRYVPTRTIATIRYWRDWAIVIAPDYIHRQLSGYPELKSASAMD